jgi:hypothetical protein
MSNPGRVDRDLHSEGFKVRVVQDPTTKPITECRPRPTSLFYVIQGHRSYSTRRNSHGVIFSSDRLSVHLVGAKLRHALGLRSPKPLLDSAFGAVTN